MSNSSILFFEKRIFFKILVLLIFSTFILTNLLLFADQADCPIILDESGYLKNQDVACNFVNSYMKIGKKSITEIYRAHFVFDTSSIPDDATIISASIYLYCIKSTSNLKVKVWDFSPYISCPDSYDDAGSGTAYSFGDYICSKLNYSYYIDLNNSGLIAIKNSLQSNKFYCGLAPISGYEGSDYAEVEKSTSRLYLHVYYSTDCTRPPYAPHSPSPADGATDVSLTPQLTWKDGGLSASYDVYFGTDSSPDSGEFKINTTSTSYYPGTLEPSTTYYWKIVAKNDCGETDGPIWHFTTKEVIVSYNLTIDVDNIPDGSPLLPGTNGKVYLYDNNWTLIASKTTDQNGVVSFSNLKPGVYKFEAYCESSSGLGVEYWGTGEVEIVDQDKSITFTRDHPYIEKITITNLITGETLTWGSSVPKGTQLRVAVKMKNPNTANKVSYPEVILDRDRNLTFDYSDSADPITIISYNWGNYTIDLGPLQEEGGYYFAARAYTNVNNKDVITDTWGYDTSQVIYVQGDLKHNLTINVNNVPGGSTLVPGDYGRVELYDGSGTNLIDTKQTSNGEVVFSSLSDDNYVYRVYVNYTPVGMGDEYWGKKSVTISGEDVLDVFTRKMPYITGVYLENAATNEIISWGDILPVGTTVRVNITVKNPDTTGQINVKNAAIFDSDKQLAWDFTSESNQYYIEPNKEHKFLALVSLNSSGKYYFGSKALSLVEQSWLCTDTYAFDEAQYLIVSDDSPVIENITPSSGSVGTIVTITGLNFGTSEGSVTFNGIQAAISSWTDTQIVTTVPENATTGPVIVHTAKGQDSNSVTFLVSQPGSNVIFFDDFEDGDLEGWEILSTEITNTTENAKNGMRAMKLYDNTSSNNPRVQLSLNTTSSRIGVEFYEWTNDYGWYGGSIYVLETTPEYDSGWGFKFGAQAYTSDKWQYITSQDKSVWALKNPWTYLASDFPIPVTAVPNTWHKIKIEIYGPEGIVKFWSDGEFKGEVQISPTNDPLKYFRHGISWSSPTGTTNYIDDFRVYEITVGNEEKPIIYSLTPDSGPVGTNVIIEGENFGGTPGEVTFNGVKASVTSWSDTQIGTIVPEGATTGPVVVTTSEGISSNGVNFTVEESVITQLVVGQLIFYADSIIQSGNVYTLSGHVNINKIIWFTGDVTFTSTTAYSGKLESEGYPYIKLQNGNESLFTSPDISYLVDGNERTLKPTGLEYMAYYDLFLSGIPLMVTAEPIRITDSGILVTGNMAIGTDDFLLCFVQVTLMLESIGDVSIQNLVLDLNNPSEIPGIGVKSISLNYDGSTDELTGVAELAFPFLGIDSVEAAISVLPGCIDGFRIEVALKEGIVLGTTGLKITGFTLEVDNICDPPHFYIFMGGDLGITGIPTDILVLDDSGLGYQHPYRLNIEGGTARLFDYPIASLSGYIDASGSPDKTGLGVRGRVDFAGYYIADIDLQLLVLLHKFTGKAKGVLQIPDLNCSEFNFKCLIIKTALESLGLTLPYQLASQEMDIEIEEKNGEWRGWIRGMVVVLDWSFATALNYDNNGFHFLIGKNYESLIHILSKGEIRALAGTTEQILVFPTDLDNVIFAAQGTNKLPEIYLKTPSGEMITGENVSTYPGVNYSQNEENLITVFTVDKVTSGTWVFGVSNLDVSEVNLDVLSPRPIPQTSFTEVSQSEGIVNITTSITSTRPDTKVSLFYSDRSSGGVGVPIIEDVSASSGIVNVSWDTSEIEDGTYYLFAKTFDDSNLMVVTYYGEPIIINNKGIKPPSNLEGSRSGDTVYLNWTESPTTEVVGYSVLYTDEPEVGGYKYQKGANERDQAEVKGLDPNKEYRFAVVAFDENGNFSLESNAYYTSPKSDPEVWEISDGVRISDVCEFGKWQYYKIEVPNGSDSLEVKTLKATGDVDLYIKKDEKPDLNYFDLKASTSSGNEIIVIKTTSSPSLTSGYWYIGVYGNEDTSYDLVATISSSVEVPEISLSRESIYIGVVGGETTSAQEILISNIGGGTLNWTVSQDAGWLVCSPVSGTGDGLVTVEVNASSLGPGTYQATIKVSDPAASNSPQTVDVILQVFEAGKNSTPFGSFDTPGDRATVYGNVPVTGWALDDIEVEKVEIKREPVSSDPAEVIGPDGLVYIGEAVFVEGARPDVEASYPGYPLNYRAGWGYMMLTNFLPNSGNGTFTIYAIAYDKEGNRVTLGTKTIICDNANSELPFGTIDTPGQGGVVSGAEYVNFGWALTPQPKYIPYDGSTIWVFVDGVPLGHPVYNNYRVDIATLFPGYANSDGAVGYYYLDTTAFDNGVHNVAWSVEDSEGRVEGIGSRYFKVFNGEGANLNLEGIMRGSKIIGEKGGEKLRKEGREGRRDEGGGIDGSALGEEKGKSGSGGKGGRIGEGDEERTQKEWLGKERKGVKKWRSWGEVAGFRSRLEPVYVRRGFNIQGQVNKYYPDEEGVVWIEIKEIERVVVSFGSDPSWLNRERLNMGREELGKQEIFLGAEVVNAAKGRVYKGYLKVQDELRRLPIGSRLDSARGVFYWQPGPGFIGEYDLVFLERTSSGEMTKQIIRIKIKPKF